MITHELTQGSPEWHAYRAQHDNASDAPAMMGCSLYKSRSQLLHERHTGLTAEVDAGTQHRFDDGHRFEALARPLAAKIIGQDLYPVTGSLGTLSASFDGLTMDESIAFEHKSLNDDLRAVMPAPDMVDHEPANALIPLHYRVQMEQQCMVSGARAVLFMATKWDGETLVEAKHCWYEPDDKLREQIERGWEQFHKDLAEYVPPTAAAAAIVAAPVQALPAVSVRVEGTIAVFDNFDKFEVAVRDFIEHRLILKPQTDQDFADLDTQIKAMKGAREAIKAGKAQMLAQIEPVDVANKRADMLDKLLQTNQSMAERLLASEKEARRTEIVTKPAAELRAYMTTLNRELGAPYVPMPAVDFGGAIKGMRSLTSMEDAVATRLANAKIDANAVAATVRANLKTLDDLGAELAFLFADKAQLVLKAPDDFTAVTAQRVDTHKRAEQERLDKERERIRAEEVAKLERESAEKMRLEMEESARLKREEYAAAEAKMAVEQPAPTPAPAPAPAPIANVVPMRAAVAPVPAAPPTTPPTLKLGQIGERLGFSLAGDFLKSLGFEPAGKAGAAVLYHEREFPQMLAALIQHIEGVQAKQAA